MVTGNVIQRFYFIELLAWWKGNIGNKQLINQFAISRQQAYQDLKSHLDRYPNSLVRTAKAYDPSSEFVPYFIASTATSIDRNNYLQWFVTKQLHFSSPVYLNVSLLTLPHRTVSANVIRVLVQAIHQQKRMEVNYVSITNPESDGRIFHPYTLVNTGLRWHVRGYYEKSQGYRDLVLSRFLGYAELLDGHYRGVDADFAWQTTSLLLLQPDQRLSQEKQAVLANDHKWKVASLFFTSVQHLLITYCTKCGLTPKCLMAFRKPSNWYWSINMI